MENTIVILMSDCCCADMTSLQAEYGICPNCFDHCEVVSEEIREDNGEF